jgi:Excalibur calcium-binding domain
MRVWGTTTVALLLWGLSGCGGGGADKDAVCADFQYQEDAQAAYNGGATQLDGDKDGIACEALAHRPGASTGGGGASSGSTASYPPYDLFFAQGSLATLRPAFGAYSLNYHSFFSSGSATGPLAVTTTGGGSQVVTDLLTVRYAVTSDGTLVSWTPAGGGIPASTGLGISAGDAASLSELVGAYTVLGQRCSANMAICRSSVATVRISAGGTFELCPGAAYSATCAGHDQRSIVGDSSTNVWSIGNFLIGSRSRHTLAFYL